MRVYSIGREENCDIIIDDRSDVISRRHAALNVTSFGKMTIVDYSHNGTYVNGIRISSNVPVPVTRKDNISFAHVARLDWRVIPNNRAKIIRYVILAVAAILLVIGGVWGYKTYSGSPEKPAPEKIVAADSMQTQKPDSLKQGNDSLKQENDSVQSKQQQTKQKNTPVSKPKRDQKTSKDKQEEPKKEDPKQEEPQTRFR